MSSASDVPDAATASEPAEKPGRPKPPPIPPEVLRSALEAIDLEFNDDELALMGAQAAVHRRGLGLVRDALLAADVPPALRFDPRIPGIVGRPAKVAPGRLRLPRVRRRPEDLESLAFASIPELAGMIRARAVSCVELATLALERLERLDPGLHCVVTLTGERALAQARALDEELAAGRWRGPLHGIPWGAKDLLAVRDYPTTWGTPPYADQIIDSDATVVTRLDEAGAVLVAKLSLGELAWGDVWTGGRTNNPWDPSEGASGSSAGSAAAVSAGCVPFAIGSETLGSILSPSRVCGITGLRPTFGRVSRHGAMALAWSLDKLGPMCRSAEDAAIVFAAIAGPDGIDDTVVDVPFAHPSEVDPRGWRIGVVEAAFEREPATRDALDELRGLGCELVPLELPAAPLEDLWLIGEAEAATSFDELLRSGRVREMVRQEDEAWPNVFRAARLIPAVEYIRANRLRRALMIEFDERIRDLDLIVHPADEDSTLAIENFTGHPAIGLPWGRRSNGAPEGIAFAAHLDRETDLLGFAMAWQARTDHHRGRPPI